MTIEDKREKCSVVPAVEILGQIVPSVPKNYLTGIRKILLLDEDYHGQGGALARYVAIQGTKAANIELYFDHYATAPEALQSNRIFLTLFLATALMHEIYHHLVRAQRRFRKPTNKLEEERAAQWSEEKAMKILLQIFPPDRYQEEFNQFKRMRDEIMKSNPALQPTPAKSGGRG